MTPSGTHSYPTQAPPPKTRILGIGLLALIVGLAACSSGGAGDAADIEHLGDSILEPGTGTEVDLDLPGTAPAGHEIRIPVVIGAGSEPHPWDAATVAIETSGPVDATLDVNLVGLQPGGSVAGVVTVHPQAGTSRELTMGGVSVTLLLHQGSETMATHRVEFGILADDRTTWLGYTTPQLLQLDRVQALRDAGEISQREHADARATILETVTGTVEDPTQ